jgi:hypothetical protein
MAYTLNNVTPKANAATRAASAQAKQQAIKGASLNQHQVDTHTVLDVTGHATNGAPYRATTYDETD